MPTEARHKPTSHPESIKMLVLETDEQHPETHEKAGSFGDVFDNLFKTAGDNHDPSLGIESLIHFVVEDKGGAVPSVDDLGDIHAVLITGSMYDAHASDEWILKLVKFVQDTWRRRPDVRFSGVCFGHQVICRALGSTVDATPGRKWELSHTPVTLTPMGEKLFRTKGKINLHQMHQDHVVNAPSSKTTDLLSNEDEVHVWGSTETTEVQGIFIKGRAFTSQGHLGFDEHMVHKQIEQRVERGSIQDFEAADAGKSKADLKHDGEIVASAILRFFHGDDSL
ncbi:uncharacterized protein K452DRAFT_266959 [Aplosporella prunicola CBS 121167]|uniref:Glutamine amidotransferase domain-containing protein n=1 Tax=Aplosporella prunicola CBS 121167 TaxID=1176127 RepID=A0A6A6BQG1_9PEZI|nr:uncharacterized protein K452DRAFT_266959 [Aplosporella prunicola CBS 121167]KAF2144821.1 hypothetical protein K452DRAFT_266959 [Aplosporella prunicola CBS 121167]